VVNPYDIRAGAAPAAALTMDKSEQAERMRSMRRLVASFNVYRWAGRMLIDAAELRRRERLATAAPRSRRWGTRARCSRSTSTAPSRPSSRRATTLT
jgi:trehalose-6-phosphate synthase